MINSVTLIGNLGGDPEVRRLENGAVVAQLNVATNERYTTKEGQQVDKTEWHRVVAWRGLAEVAEKYFKRGQQIYVQGKLTTRKWQNKEGQDQYTTEIVADTMKILGRKGDNNSGGGSYQSSSSNSNSGGQSQQQPSQPAPAVDGPADDDDLPF